jgi:hypothetical protein
MGIVEGGGLPAKSAWSTARSNFSFTLSTRSGTTVPVDSRAFIDLAFATTCAAVTTVPLLLIKKPVP